VYRNQDVDVHPKLIRQVKAAYTREAMRARIQGEVLLACVVLTDGTVGEVRVTGSLDTAYGLDDAAIAALKQWRFSPAMKAGVPVAVIVDVNMSFALSSGAAATLSWPAGFDAPLDQATKEAEWRTDTFEVLNLRIQIGYPAGWTSIKGANEHEMIRLQKDDGMTMLMISPPQPAVLSLDRPLPPEQLERTAQRMAQSAAARSMQVESLAFGQAPAASHIWVWHAFRIPNMVAPNMPALAAAAAAQTFDGGRIWAFEGTAGDYGLSVFCITGVPRKMSDDEKAAFVTSQAAVFGEILRRMSISIVR
jgi:TonB family protein